MAIPKPTIKSGRNLQRAYLPLLLLMIAGYCTIPLAAGTDFWAHAAVGRWIIQHHQIPSHTLFLWSDSIPWIWHSWLSQVIFYELLAHLTENIGALLALILTTLAVASSLLLWWPVWIKRQVKLGADATPGFAIALIFVLAIFTAHDRFHPRPEIFSAVFLTLLLLMLIRGIASWRSLIAIFVMFALWANLHAGLAMGLLILGISIVCNLAQDRSWTKIRWELLALGIAIAGVFINPYGWHYWAALKPVTSVTFSFIDEWKPFWEFPLLDTPTIICAFLCFAAALSAWLGSERRRWAHLGWLIAGFALFILARRNIWTLVQIVLAVIACNPRIFITSNICQMWHTLIRRKQPFAPPSLKRQTLARRCVLGCLIIAALIAQSDEFWQGIFVSPKVPAGVAQYLRSIPAGKRIFNDYEISSYLEWKLDGKQPLFIDLLNAYHPKIMEDYIKVSDGGGKAEQLLKKWRIDYVVLPQIEEDQYIGRLFVWLSIQQKWEMVYNQPDGVIWKYNPNAKPKPLFQLQ